MEVATVPQTRVKGKRTRKAELQSLRALEVANERRLAGSAIKGEIAKLGLYRGLHEAARVIEDPGEAGCIRLDALIMSVHRMGTAKTSYLLLIAGVNPSRNRTRLRNLTMRERSVVASELRRKAENIPQMG